MAIHAGLKAYVILEVVYSKVDNLGDDSTAYLRSKLKVISSRIAEEINNQVINILDEILMRNDNYIRERSGLVISEIIKATLVIAEHNPLQPISRGSSYLRLPPFLENKKAIINVNNKDHRCFGYAILSALYTKMRNAFRASNYDKLFGKHQLNNINYPVSLAEIPSIEEK